MVTIAPAAIQIGRLYNEFGILAHSDTYAIDYRADARAREAAETTTLPTEAEVYAKIESGETLTPADNETLRNRTNYRIFRKCRQGWSLVAHVKGEVQMRRKMVALTREAKGRMVGQTYQVREVGTDVRLNFDNTGQQI